MPYPLPDGGPPYSTDLRWFLVAVPDDAQFVRAALGAYTEFTHYWRWGKEGKEDGREEAAQVWENAVGATLEALEMGFPDILLGYIDTVEAKLQALIDKPCCSDRLVDDIYGDNPTVTLDEDMTGSGIEVGTGTPPGGYADWEAFSSYLCDAATAFAQSLPGYLENFESVFTGLATITSAGFLLLLAAFVPVIGLPVAVVGALLLLIDLLDLQSTIADLIVSQNDWDAAMAGLLAAEDDIICAILTSDTAAEASTAVRSAIEGHSQYAADALFAILPIIPGLLRRIYNAEADIEAGFGGDCIDCTDEQQASAVDGFALIWSDSIGGAPEANMLRAGGPGDQGDYVFTTAPEFGYNIRATNVTFSVAVGTAANLATITTDYDVIPTYRTGVSLPNGDLQVSVGNYAVSQRTVGGKMEITHVHIVGDTWRPVLSVTIVDDNYPTYTTLTGTTIEFDLINLNGKDWHNVYFNVTYDANG